MIKIKCQECNKEFIDTNMNEFEVGELSKRIYCNSCVIKLWNKQT